jgi:hypothetical protein
VLALVVPALRCLQEQQSRQFQSRTLSISLPAVPEWKTHLTLGNKRVRHLQSVLRRSDGLSCRPLPRSSIPSTKAGASCRCRAVGTQRRRHGGLDLRVRLPIAAAMAAQLTTHLGRHTANERRADGIRLSCALRAWPMPSVHGHVWAATGGPGVLQEHAKGGRPSPRCRANASLRPRALQAPETSAN